MEFFNENDIRKLIDEYLAYMYNEKERKKRTVIQYEPIIERLLYSCVLDRVERYKYIDIITQSNYEMLPVRVQEQPAIGTFIEFLKFKAYIDNNVNIIIDYRKIDSKRSGMTEIFEEIFEKHYLNDEINYKNEEERVVIKCILALSYYCMFQQAELESLKLAHIDLEKKRIRNVNKPKKGESLGKWIIINDKLLKIIEEYLDVMSIGLSEVNNKGNFFVFDRKQINYTNFFNNYIGRFIRRSELEFNGQYKTLRTNFMYNYLDKTNGEGLIDLQRTVGIGDRNLKEACSIYFNLDKLDDVIEFKDKEVNRQLKRDSKKEALETIVQIDSTISINNKKKVDILTAKLIRNRRFVDLLRNFYDNSCQVCGKKLKVGVEEYYSEVHHIKAYNDKVEGDDDLGNMIVLCPDCHKQFDRNYCAINPKDLKVYYYENGEIQVKSEKLYVDENLKFGIEYLEYAWLEFLDKYNIKGK